MNIVRLSHEHRALHGVSRAWHAAGHTAVVAGAVPSSVDIAQLLALSQSLPTSQPTERRERKDKHLAAAFPFFFLFSASWVRCIPPTTAGRGGVAVGVSILFAADAQSIMEH